MNFIKLNNFIFKNVCLPKHMTKKAYIFLKNKVKPSNQNKNRNDNILNGFCGLIYQIHLNRGLYWVCGFSLKKIFLTKYIIIKINIFFKKINNII